MRKNRYAILAMGTIVFLMLGFMYMWSNFQGAIKADVLQIGIDMIYTPNEKEDA